jgi:hypothetical protein
MHGNSVVTYEASFIQSRSCHPLPKKVARAKLYRSGIDIIICLQSQVIRCYFIILVVKSFGLRLQNSGVAALLYS